MGILSKLFLSLKKTKAAFIEKLKRLFAGSEINEKFFDELEEILISSDIGVSATMHIIDELKVVIKQKKIKQSAQSREELKNIMLSVLNKNTLPESEFPLVFLIVGVNGVGKTTTIGKLAHFFHEKKKKVLIAAADTFRAAAADQLAEWAERSKSMIVKSASGADPGAVVFDSISSFKAKNADVLIIDTAGRLHNKIGLMNELKKISKIVAKELPNAVYRKAIVIDATTGQNAVEQVRLFNESVELSEIIVTKLDGTAKGGVVFALSNEFSLPISFVGLGEKIDDLEPFNAKEFVDSIFD